MSKKIYNLDPLRFILALCVVLFHIPTISETVGLPFFSDLPVFQKGTEAVLVFFTLSGFLIIRSLYVEKVRTNSIAIQQFYIRRILRIYPVYYLVMIIGFLLYHGVFPLLNIPYTTDYPLWEGILLCVFLLPNVFHVAYDPGGILGILWSIGIEEQFYLFIAPLAFLLKPKRIIQFLVYFSMGYFLLYFFSPIAVFRDYYSLFFYFSFGGLLSILNYLKKDRFLLFSKPIQCLLLTAFMVHFTTNIFTLLPIAIYHLFSMLLFGVFILNISFNPAPLFVIKNATWNYLGKISYGIYMYHMIIVTLVLFLTQKLLVTTVVPSLAIILWINIITISLTIFVAHLSYKYMEMPFLQLKDRFRNTSSGKVRRLAKEKKRALEMMNEKGGIT